MSLFPAWNESIWIYSPIGLHFWKFLPSISRQILRQLIQMDFGGYSNFHRNSIWQHLSQLTCHSYSNRYSNIRQNQYSDNCANWWHFICLRWLASQFNGFLLIANISGFKYFSEFKNIFLQKIKILAQFNSGLSSHSTSLE